MRAIVVVAAAGLSLAACNKGADNTVAPAATPTPASTGVAPAGFTPPTSISRAEYGGRTERRFRRLDRNGDGKLEASELPQQRAQRLLRRMDTNGDGSISATEWSDGMLARFDKQDVNRDGNLTSDERGKRGGGRRRQRELQPAGGTIPDEGDEVDNGM
jgi:hypothetical protein